VWGKGLLVPGVAALNAGGDAAVTAISCAAPGYCTAVNSEHYSQGFVVSEVNGTWGTAQGLRRPELSLRL
jgi:hypothetical protein